jgi:glyoxylase-like metal-dependent hydrolase (beta-lactamase superfamily II)
VAAPGGHRTRRDLACPESPPGRLADQPGIKRRIDLAIITHIDHDHIGAAQRLFSDRELNLSFGDVWFNARTHLGARGVAEGQGLGVLLGDAARDFP